MALALRLTCAATFAGQERSDSSAVAGELEGMSIERSASALGKRRRQPSPPPIAAVAPNTEEPSPFAALPGQEQTDGDSSDGENALEELLQKTATKDVAEVYFAVEGAQLAVTLVLIAKDGNLGGMDPRMLTLNIQQTLGSTDAQGHSQPFKAP